MILSPRTAVALWATLLLGCGQPTADSDSEGEGLRIAALAPHLAELVVAAGAGDRLVGVSAYSDYPEDVRRLPIVADAFTVDRERLALLRANLLLAWESGTPAATVANLRQHGFRVEVLRSRGLADVADALRRIGALTGTPETAAAAAQDYLQGLDRLRKTYADATPINVFYQVAARPLYTVNGAHYVSELIALCGGRNVFATLSELAPTVSAEAVLVRDPEVLLTSQADDAELPFSVWDRWPDLAANRYQNRFGVPADIIGRAGPRLVRAGQAVCERLQQGRRNRDAYGASKLGH